MKLSNKHTALVQTTVKVLKTTCLFLALTSIVMTACSTNSNPTEADTQIKHIQISPDSLYFDR